MKVFLATEFRCTVYKEEYYLATRAYVIFVRYAEAFGDIILCSRFERVDELPFDCVRANFVKGIVDCESLGKTLLGGYKNKMMQAIKDSDLVVGRFPSIIAFRARDYAKKLGKVFVAELMCDGLDSYWNHSLKGKLIAPYMTMKMRQCTWDADFAIYVTEKFLQSKYPCKNPTINASNVVIKDINQKILAGRLEKIKRMDINNISMMTSACVAQHSKGQEYVIKAIGLLKKKGINVTYYLAGEGSQKYLRQFAQKAGVEEQIIFMGRLAIERIFEKLDEIDIYIQPSLQEGLPRAVIEALSRACPVMGARTAGIPELMDDECVFERASAESIAKTAMVILKNGLEGYAKRNFEHSKLFLNDTLNKRRNEFYKQIRNRVIQNQELLNIISEV
ncbi:MAG: glycosyltransferase [Dorea sp.]|nr:glycosyltransferase [Dorea sp.]